MAIQFTANFQLPYPAADRSDTADVPRDIKAIADKLDTTLLAVRRDDLIGEVRLWPIAAPPDSFVICDGSLLDRLGTYNRLYQAIGLTYTEGGADGTKFRIPDTRGRALIGVDGSAARITGNDALGSAGGRETVPLAVANLPSHAHADSIAYGAAGSHSHGGGTGAADVSHNHFPPSGAFFATQVGPVGAQTFVGPGSTGQVPVASAWRFEQFTNTANLNHAHTIGADGDHAHAKSGGVLANGGDQEHNNLPPYLVINYIIRYA